MSARAGFPSLRRSTISLASQQTTAWVSVMALISVAVARFAAPVTSAAVVGSDAWLWLFAAVAGFVAAGTSGALGLSTASRVIGFFGRAMLVLVVISAVLDSSGVSVPHQVAAAGLGILSAALGALEVAIVVVAAFAVLLVVAGWVFIHFVPSLGPTLQRFALAAAGRGTLSAGGMRQIAAPVVRTFVSGLALSVMVVLAAVAQWLLNGATAFGAQADNIANPVRPAAGVAAESWASRFRASTSNRKPTRPVVTVYRNQINVARQDGALVPNRQRHWKVGKNADAALVELREIAEAVVTAYDTALNKAPSKPGDTFDQEEMAATGHRPSKGRFTGYTISVVRAWSEHSQHALVVKITPPAAAEEAARLSPDRIIPLVDSHSSWSYDDLKDGLNLSARLRDNAHREGQIGLFMTLAREGVEAPEGQAPVAAFDEPAAVLAQIPDGLQERLPGIRRAVGESMLSGRLRLDRFIDDQESDVLEFHARQGEWHGFDKWQELVAAWNDLAPRLRHYTAVPQASLTTQVDPYALVVSFPKPPAQFPSGDAMLWRPFIERNLAALRRTPLRFPIGVDRNSQTVFGELASDTPAWLIAGEPGSGKSAGVVVPMLASLFAAATPDRLKVTLVDSTKRELLDVFGLEDDPHILRSVSSRDGTERVLGVLDAFLADMDAAYGRYAAQRRHFDPRRDAAHVLFIEELADLFALTPTNDGLKGLHNRLQRAVQVGRGAGFYLVATIQLPKATLLPTEIRSLFGGRIVGYYTEAGSYRIALDEHRRFFDTKIAGRMVVRGGVDRGDTFVQTYYLPPKECLKFIAEQRDMYGLPPTDLEEGTGSSRHASSSSGRPGYNPRDIDAGDEPMAPRRTATGSLSSDGMEHAAASSTHDPEADLGVNSARCPTQTEVTRSDTLTGWRILTRNVAPGGLVGRSSVAEWIRGEGLTPPGNDQLSACLAALMNLDLLEYQGPTRPRIMGSVGWKDGAARILETTRSI